MSNIYKIYNSLFKETIKRLVSLGDFKVQGLHSLKILLHCSKTSDVIVQTRKHNSYNSYVTAEGLIAAPLATSNALESHRKSMCARLCVQVCVCVFTGLLFCIFRGIIKLKSSTPRTSLDTTLYNLWRSLTISNNQEAF